MLVKGIVFLQYDDVHVCKYTYVCGEGGAEEP
jgi:hypothetical protein